MSRKGVMMALALSFSGLTVPTHVAADVVPRVSEDILPYEFPGFDRERYLQNHIRGCSNVYPETTETTKIQVGFRLDRNGKVEGNEVHLLSTDGDQHETDRAFEAARRAILRCQFSGGGYQFSPDEYEMWKDVVITFDLDELRQR